MTTSPYDPRGARPGPVRAGLDRLVASGEIEPDPAQRALADRLDALDKALSSSALASKSSALGWLFGRAKPADPVRGVYIHGDVGRGKTMIMDMFFRSDSVNPKRRVHFHAFMGEVHDRIGAHREAVKAGAAKGGRPDPAGGPRRSRGTRGFSASTSSR